MSFKASLDGFIKGCRPMIGLDGCFMKGKYGGVTFSATALDGNNGSFLLAIYLARGETYENWFSFLEILKPHIMKHNNPITSMSDMGKGLRDAVRDLFLGHPHRFCFRNMYKNFKKEHNGLHMEKLSWGGR